MPQGMCNRHSSNLPRYIYCYGHQYPNGSSTYRGAMSGFNVVLFPFYFLFFRHFDGMLSQNRNKKPSVVQTGPDKPFLVLPSIISV